MNHIGGASKEQTSDSSPAAAFLDYFGCPEEFARLQVSGELSDRQSFFSFESARCYGRTTVGNSSQTTSNRRFDSLSSSDGVVSSFFNPTEVIENLRRERYVPSSSSARRFRELYYSLRPILPFSVRRLLHRSVFRSRIKSFPRWPVDCSVEQIFRSVMKLAIDASGGKEIPFIWFWPEGKRCATMMTHDVEEEPGAAHCDMLMDLDDSWGIKASFQLVPEGRYRGVDELTARIRARGFEANIHDLDHDGRLYEHVELFRQRSQKINDYARKYQMEGFRAGAMHRNQDWFDMLAFQYDMSVPNVAHLEPQSGGCCTVTPYFIGNVLELPLTTVQDHSLFFILGEHSIDIWQEQIKTISAHHGLISFIVHPDYVVQARERKVYCELLQYLSRFRAECDSWFALPQEINRWWRERREMRLVRERDGWKIRGQGCERARLAYAAIVDGKVRYRIAGNSYRSPTESSSVRDSDVSAEHVDCG